MSKNLISQNWISKNWISKNCVVSLPVVLPHVFMNGFHLRDAQVDMRPAVASIIGVAVLETRMTYNTLAMMSATERAQRSYWFRTGFKGDLWFFTILDMKALPTQEQYLLGDLCQRRARGSHFTAVTHYGRGFLFQQLLEEHHGNVGNIKAPFLCVQLPQPFALGLIQGSLGAGFLKEACKISCMGF